MRTVVLLLLASAFAPVPVIADPGASGCAEIRVDAKPLPNGTVVPVHGKYEANLTYQETGSGCPVTLCYDPEGQVRFTTRNPPEFSHVQFSPSNPRAWQPSPFEYRQAKTVLTIHFDATAPAGDEVSFEVLATGCSLPSADTKITVRIADAAAAEPGSGGNGSGGQGSEDEGEALPQFKGTTRVPGPGVAVALLAIGFLAWLRRRA